MAKHLVQLIVTGATVVGRAFSKALRQEIAASQAAAARAGGGARGAEHSATSQKLGLSLEEAKQILHVEELNDKEVIEEKFKYLFEINDKAKGGSFYLQSKIIPENSFKSSENTLIPSWSSITSNRTWSIQPIKTNLLQNEIIFKGFNLTNNCTRNYCTSIAWDKVISEENKKQCIAKMGEMPSVRLFSKKPEKFGAVLIPLCHVDGELSFLYTVRSKELNKHKGEISFPGGMFDESDKDLIQTALRETREEIGIMPENVEVWGSLATVPSRQDSQITPVFGYIRDIYLDVDKLNLSTDEVESVFTVPLKELCLPKTTQHTQYRSSNSKNGYTLPLYITKDYKIWGLTAIFTHMALSCLLPGIYRKKLKHNRPLVK